MEEPLIIQIYLSDDVQVDWHISSPRTVTFQDVLDAIAQASDDKLLATYFEYKDEDGDRITVKSDEELHAMINFHMAPTYSQGGAFVHEGNGLPHLPSLVVYPKNSKPARSRNVHDLKVAIAPTASSKILSNNLDITVDDAMQAQEPCSSLACENDRNSPAGNTDSFEVGQIGNNTLLFLETIGNGNSGVVQRAVHRQSGTITAVKSITLDLTDEEQKRILLELKILRKCNGSPFIISFYGAYFDENRVLLCTEFMDGGSLDKHGVVPEPVLRNVASAISFGLKHLWSLRIMHRDVKPSNVLVNSSGQIKLCDFGVSTQLVDSIARTYVGTNAYMAPERVVGRDYTIYSDVWSFGLSLCELALGNFPYPQLAAKIAGSKGVVPMEIMQCIVNDDAPRLPPEHFSPDLVDFVICCLQKEADKRLLPEQLCLHHLVTTTCQLPLAHRLGVVSQWLKQALAQNG
uniref:dual specificity mitogen-activated protein kinase kinase 5 n=1 Tax=Ciona intestinalis TaxID=7719 RepID=UPI000180CB60|nr:dual specificity mitogen-activated protein kinase kinase 5 [Ciona intestinalis]|eukprot:XP_009860116.1 dual specificity mitogen-activated protein kinase kinase 5 [Ciona intestinalis]